MERRTDGQTDGKRDKWTDGRVAAMKLIVTFGNLAKAPEKSKVALSIRQQTWCEGQKERPFS